MPDKTPRVASGVYCPMENVMNDSSRDPIITEDEVRALNFTPEDILEIEKVILSSVHVARRKVAMVVGMTIGTLRERDEDKWKHVSDIYCAYVIRCLVFRGELVGYGDLFRMRYSEISLPGIMRYKLPAGRLVLPADVNVLPVCLPPRLSRRIWNGGNGISIPCSRKPARINWWISWRNGIRCPISAA